MPHPKAEAIIREARRWLNTPFMHQQRRIGVGIDCGGLLYEIGVANRLPVFDVRRYTRQPDGSLLHVLDGQCVKLRKNEAEGGDILVLAPFKKPQHLVLLTFDNTIIHANESRCERISKVVEHRYSDHWVRSTVAAYRLPE